MKTFLGITILLIFTFCQKINGQTTNSQTTIDGLFGIKLGEPLPASCTNSWTLFSASDEWGFQIVNQIIPPKPNAEFDGFLYSVTLTANRLVCAVSATKTEVKTDDVFNGLRDTLRSHYGKEDENKSHHFSEYDSAYWSFNHHSLELVLAYSILTLTCQNDALASHPSHKTDTNGL